jgi:two-component system response regulator AgrA
VVRVVVVDDDKEELEHIKDLLDEVVKEEKEVVTFTRLTDRLKKEIQNTDLRKIYVLDIEIGHKVSGISIAKLIRDVDWESEIIFITNHDKMFESVHRTVYEVFDFIEKFHEFDKRFKKDIQTILKRNFDNKMFVYKTNNIELNLYYKSILYIYRDTAERKLVIVTDSNKYMIGLSIKEIIPYLDYRFVKCYKSCIVNTARVQEKNYKDGYFTLDNGEKVYMLSKKCKKDLEND